MGFSIFLNKESADGRVAELGKICEGKDIPVNDETAKQKLLFIEPRAQIPADTSGFTYVFGYAKNSASNYVCLSDDDKFIEENNYLTALAMEQILIKRFGHIDMPILVMGWGKLTAQLEKVLVGADIHILNFNHHKVPELTAKYGLRAYFETVNFKKFPVVINTIPKQVVKWHGGQSLFAKDVVIYELASPPYGFDFGGGVPKRIKYEILPGLPGKYYPQRAAQAVFDCIMRFVEKVTSRPVIVLCITGSSCSYLKLFPVLRELVKSYDIIPVLSPNANLPNRFVDIGEFRTELREVCGNNTITTIAGAELLSSNKNIVASLVFPATGNTISKLANAVTDTPVCMAVKALLRNSKPCIVGISTNDALSGNAANIGTLLNRKNYYFVPFSQDDPANKPFSMVCDFGKVGATIAEALKGRQLQPIVLG